MLKSQYTARMMKPFKKNVTKLEIPMELPDLLKVYRTPVYRYERLWFRSLITFDHKSDLGKRYTKFSLCCYDSCMGSTSWPVYRQVSVVQANLAPVEILWISPRYQWHRYKQSVFVSQKSAKVPDFFCFDFHHSSQEARSLWGKKFGLCRFCLYKLTRNVTST